MPIRQNTIGVFALGITAVAVFMSLGFIEPVSAAPASSVKKTVSKSTTKGVQTKTAYQTRLPAKTTAKKVATKPVKKPLVAKASAASAISLSDSAGDTALAEKAKSLVGIRYRWGGTSTSTGFDCSGLVKHVYGDKAGNLPRSSAGMYSSVTKTSDLQPGDLVFFGRGRVSHAAVYVGNGQVVHAATPRTGVRTDSVHTLARALGYMGGGRI